MPTNKDNGLALLEERAVIREEKDIILSDVSQSALDEILMEHNRTDVLRSYGLQPAQKLLFCGPPGCGKTLADRVGKGLRSAPRDAMVADATPSHMRGYAFGFHRALDNAGAVAGALAAAAVLAWSDLSLSEVILWSAIPGFVAVALLGAGVKNEKNSQTQSVGLPRVLPPLRWSALSVPMQHYLWVLMLFTFARASETFILLFGHELGIGVVELLLLWATLNFAKAVTSTQGGQLADHFGRGALILIGWSALAIALMLSQVTTGVGLWMVSIFYGLLMGMSEGAERAAS